MPKLFQINITANWGSTGKIAEQIGLCAMMKGWDSYIAYGRWSNPSKSNLIKVGNKMDMYLHYGEQRIRDNEGLCSRCATKRLIAQIKEIKPDVIQLHNIHDHYLNYKLLFEYLNQTEIQVVWTFHDCWAFTGHCFHFVTKNCNKWKTGCNYCPLVHEYPNTMFDRSERNYKLKKALFQECKNLTIVPCSKWMEGFVKESFLKDKRTKVIHNGVDLSVFKPSLIEEGSDKFKILAVSSVWNKDKGLYDIFELRNKLPEDYEITMVGLSFDQSKKLPKGIVGIQRTQNVQELVALYSSADVLINPTYADTFPTINLEALACGTPVITYRTGGSPESIDEKTGKVIPQGDVEALRQSIVEYRDLKESKDGEQFYKSIRQACRNRAEKYYDLNQCFEEYIRLYEELIN